MINGFVGFNPLNGKGAESFYIYIGRSGWTI